MGAWVIQCYPLLLRDWLLPHSRLGPLADSVSDWEAPPPPPGRCAVFRLDSSLVGLYLAGVLLGRKGRDKWVRGGGLCGVWLAS